MTSKIHPAQKARRSNRGLMGSYLNAAVILIAVGMGAIAVDVAHVGSVRHELQNAVDAAALAGAQDLTTDLNSCERHARTVCGQNFSDGWSVSDDSQPVDVSVEVTPPTTTTTGRVRVTGTITSPTLLAKIFSCLSSQLTCSAAAGGLGTLKETTTDMMFPLAVSIDAARRDLNIRPLNELHVGDTFELYINSQQFKNAAFTSFLEDNVGGNWIRDAIDQSLGIESNADPITISPIEVGDDINMINGVIGQKQLARDPYFSALLNEGTIFLPVISGTAPFNQTMTVVGFIGVDVTSITVNLRGGAVERISVVIKKTLCNGIDGALPSTGNTQTDAALQEMTPTVCKLIE